MKYLLLLYVDPAKEPAPDSPEFAGYIGGYYAASQKMVAAGAFLAGEGLCGVETATSLRIRGGKVETMDGPFAETREHLGGFYQIDAPDLAMERAILFQDRTEAEFEQSVAARGLMGLD